MSRSKVAGLRRRRWSVVLMSAGLGCGAGLILLAHPLFALGVWQDGQPMGIGLLGAAGLCLLGLMALAPRSRLVRRALVHPLSTAPFALSCWTLATALFADRPWRSVFGPAETGQGALWYLALSAFAAAALVLRRTRRPWAVVVAIAAAASAFAALSGVAGLSWLYPLLVDWDLVPASSLLGFNEYLAYAAVALLVIAIGWWRDGRGRSALALCVIAVLVLLVSRNRTAFVVVPVAFAFAVAAVLHGRLAGQRWMAWATAALAALAAVAPAAAELWMASSSDGGPLSHSLWSRAVILKAVLPALQDGVWPLLVGQGWGGVPEALIRHLPHSGISLHDTQWGGLQRDIFHSHNAVMEAVLATGLPGAAAAALLPAAALAGAGRRMGLAVAFVLCWAVLDAFWFMVPASLPLIAMAAASLPRRLRPAPVIPSRLPPIIAATAALACVAAAAALWAEAAEQTRLARSLIGDPETQRVLLPRDLRGDGRALANVLVTGVSAGVAAGPALPAHTAQRLRDVQDQARRLADAGGRPVLAMALVNAVAAEAFAPAGSPLAWSDGDALAAAWDTAVRRLLREAPERLDVLAPYLNWLLATGRDGALAAMIVYGRGIAPDHPVLLWFGGIRLLADPAPQRQAVGLQQMRQALQAGLECFTPVDPVLKQGLGQPELR
jgi:hypothetical protein